MKLFWSVLALALISTTSVFAQCDKLSNHPQGEEFAKRQFVYRDFIKAENYEAAIPQWRDLYTHCRAGNGYILRDGEDIFEYLAGKAEKAGDKALMANYLDTVGIMIAGRAECYGSQKRKSTGLPYKGYYYYLMGKHYVIAATKFAGEETANTFYLKALEALDNAVATDGNRVEENALALRAFAAVELFKAESEVATIDKMREVYASIESITSYNVENATPDAPKFEEAKKTADEYFSAIEKEVFDCEFFVNKVKADFYAHFNDPDYIKDNIRGELAKGDCDDSNEFYALVKSRYEAVRDSIDYANKNLIQKGYDALKQNDYTVALDFFTKGVADEAIPADQRFDGAMRAGTLYERESKWQQSLDYYRKATELNSNSGQPYIRIGMLYLRANRGCDGFERQVVANISIDYFNKAKNYSDTAAEADDKISEYRQYLPTSEQVFQRPGYSVNGATTAGCVLRASTTVRTKD